MLMFVKQAERQLRAWAENEEGCHKEEEEKQGESVIGKSDRDYGIAVSQVISDDEDDAHDIARSDEDFT